MFGSPPKRRSKSISTRLGVTCHHCVGAQVCAIGSAPLHGLVAASGVLLLGSALRLYGLDRQSAWADEITTLLITDPALTFAQFWHLATRTNRN